MMILNNKPESGLYEHHLYYLHSAYCCLVCFYCLLQFVQVCVLCHLTVACRLPPPVTAFLFLWRGIGPGGGGGVSGHVLARA